MTMIYKSKKLFEESSIITDGQRAEYVKGIEDFIKANNRRAKNIRTEYMPPESFIKNIEKYRSDFNHMLGIDKILKNEPLKFEKTYVGKDDTSTIYRLKVYITDNVPFYALLLIPHNAGACMPVAIAQHGGGGTPELCSDFEGKNNYNHMVQRILEKGFAVIAPQLMLWSVEEKGTARAHNVTYDRRKADNSLMRFGMSLTGLEISGIMRCIDYACSNPEFDSDKIIMIGLSYGGYYTMHTMAADERIKAGYAAGFFNDRDVYDWMDWSYNGSAVTFQDAEVAALCAPRSLYVSVGTKDEVFNWQSAVGEAERAAVYFKMCGAEDNFIFKVWDGGHTIEDANCGFDFMLQALK